MASLVRLAPLCLAVSGLLGFTVQPAHSNEVAVVAFQGNVVLSGGHGFAVVTGDPVPCVTGATTKPSPKVVTANLGACGNLRNFNISALAAAGYVAVGKPKFPAGAGVGTVNASGWASGFCGLATGAATGAVTGPNAYAVTFKFTVLGGTLVFTGTVTKANGQHGAFDAAVEVATLPTVTGTSTGNSCLNKGSFLYTAAGAAVVKTALA